MRFCVQCCIMASTCTIITNRTIRFKYKILVQCTSFRKICGLTVRFNVTSHIPIYIQQDATLHSLFISGNCPTCFGWYLHPSSGAHTTVSTASGICHNVTAICRYRGRAGTSLRVLWVAYATHSTLKPVPTLPR